MACTLIMHMRGIGISIAAVALFVLVTWAVASSLGYQMSLASSLLLSVGLTLVLNLVLRLLSR